ncbi:conserved hypothetical protein [Neospora caninum Liverpool]|nr:conserved hypothetical protein [Neospora caninum Liverpool]CBZ56140.1 conserved hypothetical protein [Neospora caninum Liverpool]|eukprot:XP_003886166.1 conserved hypothetical protein [Neospora caninum Liverpool]
MFLSSLLSLGVRPSAPFLAAACCYVFVYAPHFPPQALALAAYNIARIVAPASGRALYSLEQGEAASSLESDSPHQACLVRLLLTQSIALNSSPSKAVGGALPPRFPSSPRASVPPFAPSFSHGPAGPVSPPACASAPNPRFASPLQLLVTALLEEMAAQSSRLKAVDWCCGLQALQLLLPLISPSSSADGTSSPSPVKGASRSPGGLSFSSRNHAVAPHAETPWNRLPSTEKPGSPSSPPVSPHASSQQSVRPSSMQSPNASACPEFSSVQHEVVRTASDLAARVAQIGRQASRLLGSLSDGDPSAPLLQAVQSLLRLLPAQVTDFPASSLSNTALAVSRLHKILLNLFPLQSSTDATASPNALAGPSLPHGGWQQSHGKGIEEDFRPSLASGHPLQEGRSPPSVAAILAPVYVRLCRRSRQASTERPGLAPVSCVILLSSLVDGLRALQTWPCPPSLSAETLAVPLSLGSSSASFAVQELPGASPLASALDSDLAAEILSVFSAVVPILLSPASSPSPRASPYASPDCAAAAESASTREGLPSDGQPGDAPTQSFVARRRQLVRLAWDPMPRDLVDLVGSLSFMIARLREASQNPTPEHCSSTPVATSLPPSQVTTATEDLQLLLSACSTYVIEALSRAALASSSRGSPDLAAAGFAAPQPQFPLSRQALGRALQSAPSNRSGLALSPRDVSTLALQFRRCEGLTPDLFSAFSHFLGDRSVHRLLTGTDFCCFLEALVRLELPGTPQEDSPTRRTGAGSGRPSPRSAARFEAAERSEKKESAIDAFSSGTNHRKAEAALKREAARLSVHLLDGVLPATISRFDSRALSSFALWLGHHFQNLQIYDQSSPPNSAARELSDTRVVSPLAAHSARPAYSSSSLSFLETSSVSPRANHVDPLPALSLLATRGQLERAANVFLKEVARRCMASTSDRFPSADPSSTSPSLFSEGRSYTALLCGMCKLPRAIIASSLSFSPPKPDPREASAGPGDPVPQLALGGLSPLSPSGGASSVQSPGAWRDTSLAGEALGTHSEDLSPSSCGAWSEILRILLDPGRVQTFLSSARTTDAEFADFLWAIRHLPLLPGSTRPPSPSSPFPSAPLPSSRAASLPQPPPAEDDSTVLLPELRDNLLRIALETLGAETLDPASRSVSCLSPSFQTRSALSSRMYPPPAHLPVSPRMDRLSRDSEALSRVFFYTVLLGATTEDVLNLFYPTLLSCLASGSPSRRRTSLPAFAAPGEACRPSLLQPKALKPVATILSALRAFPSSSRRVREQKVAVCAGALSCLAASCSSLPPVCSPFRSAWMPSHALHGHDTAGASLVSVPGTLDCGQMIEASLATAVELRVNEPAEAVAALSGAFLLWALPQAATKPLASSERPAQTATSLPAGWIPLSIRVAVALRSLDFPCAPFLVHLLPHLVQSLSAVLGRFPQRRQHASGETSRGRSFSQGASAPSRLHPTPAPHASSSSTPDSAVLPPSVFAQVSELLFCVVCAAGPHVRRELARQAARSAERKFRRPTETGESAILGRDATLIQTLYFGEPTVGLLQTLLELRTSPHGAQANDAQRRLDFLSVFHILQDAVSLGLPLGIDYVRLLHAISLSVSIDDGRHSPTHHENPTLPPCAAPEASAVDAERQVPLQTEATAGEEAWDLRFPGSGTAERPESSALHKEVLAVTARLIHRGRWPRKDRQGEATGSSGDRASFLDKGEWSLEDDKVQAGDPEQEWQIVSESRLGRLYYIDILVTRNERGERI